MIFASMESKLPPMTSPSTMPVSRRTPGPAGGSKTATVPGAGRKLRPASGPGFDGIVSVLELSVLYLSVSSASVPTT